MPQTVIRVLPESAINKIAAGEVIENPASVVKELVDNAIDAEAKNVRIEIERGGFRLIRVSDDGKGMRRDDALLCLERHATSKIKDAKDLFSLTSMGFRGEALASIVAISKASLWTSSDEEVGTHVRCFGGKILKMEDCVRTPGTTFEIEDLFYNVPARKQFQKSTAASTSEIIKMVTKQILAYPFITFKLLLDGKELFPDVFSTKGEFMQVLNLRMQEVLGKNFVSSMTPIEQDEQGIRIIGFLGDPTQARQNRLGQYIFINQRAVLCPEISFAVLDGYGTRIAPRKYPSFVLHFMLKPDLIDVNVHPQKLKVRLKDEKRLKDVIRRSVLKILTGISHKIDGTFGQNFPEDCLAGFETKEVETLFSSESKSTPSFILQEKEKEEPELQVGMLNPLGIYRNYLLFIAAELRGTFPSLFESEGSSGLLLMDLVATMQTLYFEEAMQALEKEENIERQALFLPEKITLPISEAKILQKNLEGLQQLGIDIRPFGECDFLIEALPPYISEELITEIVASYIEKLRHSDAKEMVEKERKKILARIICKMIGRKKNFDLINGKELLKKLIKIGCPLYNPLGKPIFSQLTDEKIQNLFKK